MTGSLFDSSRTDVEILTDESKFDKLVCFCVELIAYSAFLLFWYCIFSIVVTLVSLPFNPDLNIHQFSLRAFGPCFVFLVGEYFRRVGYGLLKKNILAIVASIFIVFILLIFDILRLIDLKLIGEVRSNSLWEFTELSVSLVFSSVNPELPTSIVVKEDPVIAVLTASFKTLLLAILSRYLWLNPGKKGK